MILIQVGDKQTFLYQGYTIILEIKHELILKTVFKLCFHPSCMIKSGQNVLLQKYGDSHMSSENEISW